MEHIEWYKSLTVHEKINIKECFKLACGIKFEELAFLFSFKERIKILHNKLTLEGII